MITWTNAIVFAVSCLFGAGAGAIQHWHNKRRIAYNLLIKQTADRGHWLQSPIWISKDKNPFNRTELYITEVKEGYVRYSFKVLKGKQVSNVERGDYSMEFNFLYSQYKPKEKA